MNRSICSTSKSVGSIDFNRVFFPYQLPRSLGKMSAQSVFDGCLTDALSLGRRLCKNSRVFNKLISTGLFDRYLTGPWVSPPDDRFGCRANMGGRDTLNEQDGDIGKVGYEINFNRVFFQHQLPKRLAEIDAEQAEAEKRIMELLGEVAE